MSDERPSADDRTPATEPEDDTEGHSMLQYELSRNVATSRSREADEWSRAERARKDREAKKGR